MSLSTELQRLAELKASGALSESEFQRAKEKLLDGDSSPPPDLDNSLGRAANRYVSYQFWFGLIVGIIFLCIIASQTCGKSNSPFGPPSPFRGM